MDSPAATTFIFAPEIEQALVAACFAVPERIALVYRELDPAIHITQPHLRHILDAIRLAYTELGSSDFPSVIQILREENNLQECGGIEGVNNVLDQYRFGFSSPEAAEQIIAHYIEMLKAYAIGRKNSCPIYRFVRGDLSLVPNKLKTSPNSPDYVGTGKVAGHHYRVSAWQSSETLSISLLPQ